MLLVAAGGVAGALLRWACSIALPHEPGTWAWSTLVVNGLGAGLLCALLTRVGDLRVRLLLGTGLLGAFTTFSGLAVDAVLIADQGRPVVAAAYATTGIVTLLGAALLGRVAAR